MNDWALKLIGKSWAELGKTTQMMIEVFMEGWFRMYKLQALKNELENPTDCPVTEGSDAVDNWARRKHFDFVTTKERTLEVKSRYALVLKVSEDMLSIARAAAASETIDLTANDEQEEDEDETRHNLLRNLIAEMGHRLFQGELNPYQTTLSS